MCRTSIGTSPTDKLELLLYCNTDDRYVYFWRFRSSGGKIKLADHGLLNCN